MILEIARDISQLLDVSNARAAVIGGVAVALHGHIRTTNDVDLYVEGPLGDLAALLRKNRYVLQARRREFVKHGIAVHFFNSWHFKTQPNRFAGIEGVRTVSLPDLITMKLQGGLKDVLRAQDVADVIGLIRARKLTSAFAVQLHKSVHSDFRTLVKAVKKGGR